MSEEPEGSRLRSFVAHDRQGALQLTVSLVQHSTQRLHFKRHYDAVLHAWMDGESTCAAPTLDNSTPSSLATRRLRAGLPKTITDLSPVFSQMWNAAQGTLANGCTIVAYDGSPLAPMSILFDLVDKYKITFLGISPRYLQTLDSAGYKPNADHSLATLRGIMTAGSVLKGELYDWVRDNMGEQVVSICRQID